MSGRGRWYGGYTKPWTAAKQLHKERRGLAEATDELAPWQADRVPPALPREIAELAFDEYFTHHGHQSQTFVGLHRRGGFSVAEVVCLLADRCERLAPSPAGSPEGAAGHDRDNPT